MNLSALRGGLPLGIVAWLAWGACFVLGALVNPWFLIVVPLVLVAWAFGREPWLGKERRQRSRAAAVGFWTLDGITRIAVVVVPLYLVLWVIGT